jgi:hypothetical protein
MEEDCIAGQDPQRTVALEEKKKKKKKKKKRSESYIGKDLEGSGRGLILCTMPAFVCYNCIMFAMEK